MQQQQKFKFPRTFHFPESRTVGIGDKIFHDWKEVLWGKPVEISIKYDGENTTLCADGSVHARSIDSKKHWSVMISHLSGKPKGNMLSHMGGESL